MKVLILSCNTGGGHNSAASAICAYFEKMNCECDIVNALDFLPKARAELISRGHELAYKYTPRLYGVGYRISEMTPQSRMYEQNAKGADELCKVLFSGSYDVVISVHIFAAMMMTELRINREINIPSFFVATDYTCSPGVSEIVADKYFIPHEKLREEFVSQGIPANRIVASGIPVREEFCRRSDKKAARRALGMSEEGRVLLLCCGSMGCGPIRSIALRLGEIMDENDSLVIVCGSNRQLEKDLQFLTGDDIRIKICGFTDKMSLYMDAADLIITKAGGLSTTEAVMKRLPILFIDAVPGCESRNIEFMTGNAYALESDTASGMAHLVETCLSGAVDPMEMVRQRELGAEPLRRFAQESIAQDARGLLNALAVRARVGANVARACVKGDGARLAPCAHELLVAVGLRAAQPVVEVRAGNVIALLAQKGAELLKRVFRVVEPVHQLVRQQLLGEGHVLEILQKRGVKLVVVRLALDEHSAAEVVKAHQR